MKSERREKSIVYCRVSSNEQIQGTSLDMQEKLCREYAEKHDMEIAQVFVEMGESAKSAERPEFQKALACCADKKKGIDYFLVYKIDRFARNQEDHAIVKMMLHKNGVKLRSVTEPIDETPIGRAMEGVLSVFAEFDNNVRAQRSKSGMEERVKQGVWVWSAPFGYKRLVKGGNLVVDENIAPYVKEIFEEWSKGTHSYKSLSTLMYESGLRAKNGGKLYPQTIEKVIKNPIYYGVIRAFGMEVKGAFEPIISEELFFQCQPDSHKKVALTKRKAQNPQFPLRRLVVCPECQKSLTGSCSTGRGGKRHPYYHHHKKGCSLVKSHKKADVERDFVSFLNEISPQHKKYEKLFKAIVMDVWQSNYKKLDEDNERIRKEIKFLEQDRQKVFDAWKKDLFDDEEFLNQKNYINAKIRQKKNSLEEKQIEEFDMEVALSFCFDFVRDSGKTWKDLESMPEHRLRFQKLIFPENITYDGEKFGTNKLALVYELKDTYEADSSKLVTLRGIESYRFCAAFG